MSDNKNVSPLFWAVGAVFLIWNAFGCYMYYAGHTMSDEAYTKAYGPASTAVRDLFPVWGTAAFAIAVFGGLLAAIMFLMRKKIAFPLFVVSLIAGIISFIPGFTMTEFVEATKADELSPYKMPAMVLGMGIVEIFVSRMKVQKGILT